MSGVSLLQPLLPSMALPPLPMATIPGGLYVTGSPNFWGNPVTIRKLPAFRMGETVVTNRQVEAYVNAYTPLGGESQSSPLTVAPMGLIWERGDEVHLIARGEAWSQNREKAAWGSLWGTLLQGMNSGDRAKGRMKERLGTEACRGAALEMLKIGASPSIRAPIVQWHDKQGEKQRRLSDWGSLTEYSGYAVFMDAMRNLGVAPTFEGLCVLLKMMEAAGVLEGRVRWARVVPDPKERTLVNGFDGPDQAATMMTHDDSIGVADGYRGELPTEWQHEAAARGPAVRMTAGHSLENFENFYEGILNEGTEIINDLGRVRDLLREEKEVHGYRKYGTASGGLSPEEAWCRYNPEDRPGIDERGLAESVTWGSPNAYGLYMMAGGVWERCGNYYKEDDDRRSLRGGSLINNNPDLLRAAYRRNVHPDVCGGNYGLRLVESSDLLPLPQT